MTRTDADFTAAPIRVIRVIRVSDKQGLPLLPVLHPLIQPFEEGALPEDTVLRFQNPVVLVGVDE